MSLQVFLQAKLLGAEEFLGSQSPGEQDGTAELIGRGAWLSLFCEVLPRALLSELRLSRMLLGASSAEQFLLVLPEEEIPRANEFLAKAAEGVTDLSTSTLRLVWSSTENLGTWPVARKRLDDALLADASAPLRAAADLLAQFAPFVKPSSNGSQSYFAWLAGGVATATRVGWSEDQPARLSWEGGQHSWPLKNESGVDDDGILFPRRLAMDDTGARPSSLAELAQRAAGEPLWGILRGDVDQFEAQLRQAGSIEEHIHLSILFKEFFAGELSLLCTMPDFWRKVSILYRGGDDFTIMGAWDALILLARELQRVFERFAEQNFPSLPRLEGGTISMALSIAPRIDTPSLAVMQEATLQLQAAKAGEAGQFSLFGRTLEWKRMSDAEELKSLLVRLVRDFGYAPEYIHDVAAVYRESVATRALRRGKAVRVDKPWRTYMRVSGVIPQGRGREAHNVRLAIITNLIGKRPAGLKLRPSARVGLQWAQLAAGN